MDKRLGVFFHGLDQVTCDHAGSIRAEGQEKEDDREEMTEINLVVPWL